MINPQFGAPWVFEDAGLELVTRAAAKLSNIRDKNRDV